MRDVKIADHAYVPNGLGAINDEGQVPCAHCGHARGAHSHEAVPVVEQRLHRHQFGGLVHKHERGEVDHSQRLFGGQDMKGAEGDG